MYKTDSIMIPALDTKSTHPHFNPFDNFGDSGSDSLIPAKDGTVVLLMNSNCDYACVPSPLEQLVLLLELELLLQQLFAKGLNLLGEFGGATCQTAGPLRFLQK